MTWPSRICFSLLCAVQALAATVSGQVELLDSRDPGVQRHKDYSGVVVWLEPLSGNTRLPEHSEAKMLQKGKKFVPHILAIPVGTAVDFPNLDPIFHNAFSNFSGQHFDTGLYRPGTSQQVVFRRPGVVRVFCNIHSTMSAVIVVVNTPYVAVTGRGGSFRIEGVPDGDYRMKVWHERATAQSLQALERNVSISGQVFRPPLLRISESGYLEVPHKNKYDQDYPPEPPDHQFYPGVQK